MKSHPLILPSALCLAILCVAGCARYQSQPLDRLMVPVSVKNQENSVTFAYRVFDKRDCKRYLDRDVLAKGYQPIHITIANNTNRTFNFSLSSLNVLCIDPREVAEKVHTSTVKRVASYGVGSLFLPVLIIPAVVDGIGSSEANKALDFDFENKALESQVIQPYSTANGIIFTPVKNFNHDVRAILTDVETGQKITLSSENEFVKI